MNITAIIQARMGSSRLPGKVLMDISGKPMLAHVVERLKHAQRVNQVVIATSTNPSDAAIVQWANEQGVIVYAGCESDVLERYFKAAHYAECDTIVRITGDCPLIEPIVVDQMIDYHLKCKADYTGNLAKRTLPRGLDAEILSISALEKTYRSELLDYHREHVTPYIYENSDIFHVESFEIDGYLRRPDLRLCVDTDKDLELLREIYRRFYQKNRIVDMKTVICWLDKSLEWKNFNLAAEQEHLMRNHQEGVKQQILDKNE